MQRSKEAIWQEVLSVIETEVSKANFLTLFKNTALLSLDAKTATVAAPSTMIIDLIHKRFTNLIKQALEKKLEQEIAVVFIPKSLDSKKPQPDTPLFQEEKTTIIGHLPRVRADFTFETLAVSTSNQLAFTAALTVAKNIGKTYNPLFLYGPVGVGKTHLMQAIANHVFQKDPIKKIIYITSEEFTNEVVEAIRTNQTHMMKRKFRSVSLLVIDDVQFIAGKDKVQEELFHTFNILIDNGAQIVLSSDRPPQEIQKLEKRLSSRFLGGLTVDIETPDFELKTAILLIKARKYNIDLSIEIAKLVAEHVFDVRSLEGVLLGLMTQAAAKNIPISESLAISMLKKTKEEDAFRLHPDDVIRKVCDYYQIKPTQIRGPKRNAHLVRARQVAMYLLKADFGLTYSEVGNILGGRDHTTIMHGVEKIEKEVEKKAPVTQDIMGINKVLRS